MKTQTALDIVDGLRKIEEVFGIEFNQVASRICFYDKEAEAKMLAVFRHYNEFIDADIVGRGKMLGLTITTEQPPTAEKD